MVSGERANKFTLILCIGNEVAGNPNGQAKYTQQSKFLWLCSETELGKCERQRLYPETD